MTTSPSEGLGASMGRVSHSTFLCGLPRLKGFRLFLVHCSHFSLHPLEPKVFNKWGTKPDVQNLAASMCKYLPVRTEVLLGLELRLLLTTLDNEDPVRKWLKSNACSGQDGGEHVCCNQQALDA